MALQEWLWCSYHIIVASVILSTSFFQLCCLDFKKNNLIKLIKSLLLSHNFYKVEDDFLIIKSPSGSFILIKSDQRFTLKISNPENLPLFNKKLLDLQWYLSQIVGMSDAAEGSEENNYDDGYSNNDNDYTLL